MDVHIDWLSFTLPSDEEPRTAQALYHEAKNKLREHSDEIKTVFFDGQGFEPTTSRAPYRVAIARADGSARLYGSSHTSTILCELTGRGCERLRDGDGGRSIVGGLADRITRFDVAVDIRTTAKPADFANSRSHDRFRSVAFIRSATGETSYVGSAKSDRFCRVYRYNPPHPRSELLRVEFVFRRRLARDAAVQYAEAESSKDYIGRLGNTYGFNHGVWQPGARTSERLRVPIVTRDDADTIYWLYHQVAPAVRRLMDAGAIDMAEWLEYIYRDGDAPN